MNDIEKEIFRKLVVGENLTEFEEGYKTAKEHEQEKINAILTSHIKTYEIFGNGAFCFALNELRKELLEE